MKTFQEWLNKKQLNEGRPADWQPSQRMHHDAFRSALMKVKAGEKAGEMPYTGNFAGIDAIQTRLNLDDEELQALRDNRLIQRSPEGGWNVVKTSQGNAQTGSTSPFDSLRRGPAPPPPSPPPQRS